MKKKKSGQIIIVLFLLLCCFALIYLIGWNFIGGRKIKLSINESQKQQIAEKSGRMTYKQLESKSPSKLDSIDVSADIVN